MTLSNADLIERFLRGGDSGSASRMEIRTLDGVRCIVGYGWAVYAAELSDRYVLFGDGYATTGTNVGWAGYSGTTTKHLQAIKGALEDRGSPYTVADARPEVSNVRRGKTDLSHLAASESVEPLETTGYLYRQDA